MSRRARTPDPFERRIESALRPGKFVSYGDSFVFAKGLDELVTQIEPLVDDNPERAAALLHGPEQIADLPVPVAESPGAVRIGHPERSHLVEYLAPNSVFNSLPRQRSSPHLRPDDRLVTIDRVLHHASLGVA